MSAIINFSIRVDKLPKQNFVSGRDGAVYCNLTMSVNDETRYGNNTLVSMLVKHKKSEKLKNKRLTSLTVRWFGRIIKS